ncbi:cation:proton antiporter [Streptomyces sp. NPDC056930]|uniref:cation:proton antiporter domain-containing protein n=1 Tax=Streptomyces sp. NPDC056930 TaxID=3345967 RepID=UPI003645ED0A
MELSTPATLLLDLTVIVGLARLLGALARRLGQPAVIGEILGGVLLGPTLFDGEITAFLFPAEVRPSLTTLANIGVCVFMFLVGLEFNRGLLRGQGRIAVSVSLSAIVLPFSLGALLALHLVGNHPTGHRLAFVLFLGTAMSVTAFPVLARILTDKGLIDTPIGGLALAAAAVDDVLAWSMLAAVAALAGVGGAPWQVLLVLPYAAAMVCVARPLLAGSAKRGAAAGRPTGRLAEAGVLLAVAAGLLLSAEATEWMGLHQIFGAFLFGMVMPREGASRLREHALPRVERICSTLLLPVFFMVAGLKVDLSSLDVTAFGELGLILLVAIGGKFVGAFLGARLNGVRPRHSAVLAVLINTRGLTELIVLTVGLQIGVLDQPLYSLMVVMALVTTGMAGILLPFVYPDGRTQQDLAARDHVSESGGTAAGGDASALSRSRPPLSER